MVYQRLAEAEIEEITHKIEALDAIRIHLEQDLLKIHEEELELDDECGSLSSSTCFWLTIPKWKVLWLRVKYKPRVEKQMPRTAGKRHDDGKAQRFFPLNTMTCPRVSRS
jgi:hypothetical protein